jgi:Zn ribbon nucleic-acid-binding protein
VDGRRRFTALADCPGCEGSARYWRSAFRPQRSGG